MNRQILLVEDNASDEKLALLAIKRSGIACEMVVVRDGAAAIDYLLGMGAHAARDLHARPALVLLDLKLPKVDGLEVLRRCRADARSKLVPIVVLTASHEDEDVLRSYDLGANAYVRKPVEFSQFLEAARTICFFWLTLNETAPAPRGAP